MLFTACLKLKMTSKKENIESEDSGNVENKNEPLDIENDSDIAVNIEIEQVNNVPQKKSKSNQANTATSIRLPKADYNIKCLNPDSNYFEKALIIERAAKRQNKLWLNVLKY